MPLPDLIAPTSMPGASPGPVGGPGALPMMGAMPPGASPMPGAGPMGMPFGGMDDPSSRQYVAKTQADGTVLLHVKLPNGELGPAVKIISVGGKRPGA